MTKDVISRQAALALAKDICVPTKDGTVYRHRCIDPQQIMELPSAQPYSEADIQKMQDLEQAEIQRAYELGKLDAEPRWIPCSIKQPQKGLMLVAFNDGDIELLKQPTAYRCSDIVAWMPVEPYKERRTDEAN